MRETNRKEILNSIRGNSFHKTYVNPGLKEIIEALRETLQQKKVALFFSEDLQRGDDWQYIPLLPENWLDLPAAFHRYVHFKHWSKWVPHLFRPVKTIYAGYPHSSFFIQLTDLLFHYDFHRKTVRTSLEKLNSRGMMFPRSVPSFAFQDSAVNVSRFKIKLLREIFNRGGTVITHMDVLEDQAHLRLTDKQTGISLVIEGSAEPIINSDIIRYVALDKLPWPWFSMRYREQGNTFVLHETGGQPAIYVLPHPDESLIREFVNGCFRDFTGIISTPVFKEIEYRVLYQNISPLLKNFMIQDKTIQPADRPVEDLMESAFDLAKQSGISFRKFSILYYRYGQQVEWMTDVAYERMAETRNTEELWTYAEQLYQHKFEWGPEPGGNSII